MWSRRVLALHRGIQSVSSAFLKAGGISTETKNLFEVSYCQRKHLMRSNEINLFKKGLIGTKLSNRMSPASKIIIWLQILGLERCKAQNNFDYLTVHQWLPGAEETLVFAVNMVYDHLLHIRGSLGIVVSYSLLRAALIWNVSSILALLMFLTVERA